MPRKRKETEAEAPVIPELEALPPKRRAFVKNYADPSSPTFSNAHRSLVAAGSPDTHGTRVEASRVLASPSVNEALKAVYEAVGLSPALVAGSWKRWIEDSDSAAYRSPAVRASELAAKALGMLESESATAQVAVILPQLDSASLRAALRATDGEGNEVAGG